jgi:hypothetical protein
MKSVIRSIRALHYGLFLFGALFASPARVSDPSVPASVRSCPTPEVQVVAAITVDFRDVCIGAQAALAFFAAHGLQPTAPLVMEVTRQVPAEAGRNAAGSYLEQRSRSFMLPYADFRKFKTWFNVPVDRKLYQSLATHEAAHAVAAGNFKIPNPTIQAKEYVAYVAMFSTMSEDLRERVLRAMPGDGLSTPDRLTALLYMFDPMRFGAESYRHYSKLENGAAFLQSVLDGNILTD